ncbi:peptidoglycan-associated lipoprotein Pal [Kiritimatiella glycovorans]|uniref:Peptidoglycan-associated lipoprotein n=1 Tax=Kiritimatiella glycovorans TaxID=1307763 RepID=A0A0G3EI41_9BACT|nr:peptidoglycan-associated lipoprotein Pal [Kiritimatiella glycovorans]AKJ65107.1 Minor outer membrane protein Omp16 [Kiritimatiella glycovorans]
MSTKVHMLWLGLVICGLLAGGCRSRKPSWDVYGSTPSGDYPGSAYSGSMIGEEGAIPLGSRFTGGEEHREVFSPVHFAYDSSAVRASERATIEEAAEHLRNHSEHALIVEGHCDERGSREYNLALGERRALAVRDYLVNLGIEPARIQTKSYGEEKPAAMGHNEQAWSKNRRAELVLYY